MQIIVSQNVMQNSNTGFLPALVVGEESLSGQLAGADIATRRYRLLLSL